jgi:hypothetical protein
MPKPKYKSKAKRIAKPRERRAKHLAYIWETCEACAKQMAGGSRCWEHNPPPKDDRPYIRNIVYAKGEDGEYVSLTYTEESDGSLSLQPAGEDAG